MSLTLLAALSFAAMVLGVRLRQGQFAPRSGTWQFEYANVAGQPARIARLPALEDFTAHAEHRRPSLLVICSPPAAATLVIETGWPVDPFDIADGQASRVLMRFDTRFAESHDVPIELTATSIELPWPVSTIYRMGRTDLMEVEWKPAMSPRHVATFDTSQTDRVIHTFQDCL